MDVANSFDFLNFSTPRSGLCWKYCLVKGKSSMQLKSQSTKLSKFSPLLLQLQLSPLPHFNCSHPHLTKVLLRKLLLYLSCRPLYTSISDLLCFLFCVPFISLITAISTFAIYFIDLWSIYFLFLFCYLLWFLLWSIYFHFL